uniref:Uncharacterized protein n=1 Tax=Rhizophora mucronata TaxID=61149 RepID=A0A2P2JX25_RHIMU
MLSAIDNSFSFYFLEIVDFIVLFVYHFLAYPVIFGRKFKFFC